MSKLQDDILSFLRADGKEHDLKTIAVGIGSRPETLQRSLLGLEKFGLIASKKEGRRKLWRAI
jgi:DNA-binding IclR family transcriptional regulator